MLEILGWPPRNFDEIDHKGSEFILVWSKKANMKTLDKTEEAAPVVEEVTLDLDDAIEIED